MLRPTDGYSPDTVQHLWIANVLKSCNGMSLLRWHNSYMPGMLQQNLVPMLKKQHHEPYDHAKRQMLNPVAGILLLRFELVRQVGVGSGLQRSTEAGTCTPRVQEW